MKTAREIVEVWHEGPWPDEDAWVEMRCNAMVKCIETIQQDAFESGRVDGLTKAVCIVSSRTIPPKNASYTRAIEEAVVFLKSEIERLKRGEDSANVVCTPPTSTEK